jgi:hypothetical protein
MAKFKQMNKSELLKLVTEVSTSLKTIGAAEIARLAKADPSAPPEGSSPGSIGSPEGSSSSGSSSEGSSSEGSEGGIPGGDPSAPPPGMDPSAGGPPPGADPSAAPAGPPPGADPSAAPPGAEGQAPAGPSFEELVSLYAALPPPDLEAHAAALQQAVAMKQGGAGAPPGASPSAPPAGPPGAPPSPGPSAPPFGKQEVATHNPNIGLAAGGGTPGKVETANPNIGPTKKSEEDLLARLVKSEENFKALGEVVEKILTIPQRKAVTGLTIIPMAKKETPVAQAKKPFNDLTKAELHKALVAATDPRNAKLSKAERDVVTEYCLNPVSVDLSAIESIYNKS